MTLNLFTTLAWAGDYVGHVTDKSLVGDFLISNVTVMLALATLITLLIIVPAAKNIATGKSGNGVEDHRTKGAMANFVEAICLYLRANVFQPLLKENADRFAPILWTFFWFILVCNILGLIPLIDLTGGVMGLNHGHGIGGTATQSIWVTGALASISFILINGMGLIKDPVGYFKHLTGGAPWYMWIIIIPVEAAGIIVKPTALALRLFANMTGGHILLAVLWSFVPALIKNLGGIGWGLALIPLLGSTAIYMLEVLVAFLQAFIFTFLTTLFLGQLTAHGHDHDEHHDEGHDHGAKAHGHAGH